MDYGDFMTPGLRFPFIRRLLVWSELDFISLWVQNQFIFLN